MKTSRLRLEDTKNEYSKYLDLECRSKLWVISDYDDVAPYVSSLKLGSGSLSFRLPAFVHNKDEQKYAKLMFQKAMQSLRLKIPSLHDLVYVYIQRIILFKLEASIGGKHIKSPGISWVSPSLEWQIKDFEELLVFLVSLELLVVDDMVETHFRSLPNRVHDYGVQPEIIHDQNFDYKLNFYTVFALKALLRFRKVYGDNKEGQVFLSSDKLVVLQKSYLDQIDEKALLTRGLELLFEIKS